MSEGEPCIHKRYAGNAETGNRVEPAEAWLFFSALLQSSGTLETLKTAMSAKQTLNVLTSPASPTESIR